MKARIEINNLMTQTIAHQDVANLPHALLIGMEAVRGIVEAPQPENAPAMFSRMMGQQSTLQAQARVGLLIPRDEGIDEYVVVAIVNPDVVQFITGDERARDALGAILIASKPRAEQTSLDLAEQSAESAAA